jgi:hypothetical protein
VKSAILPACCNAFAGNRTLQNPTRRYHPTPFVHWKKGRLRRFFRNDGSVCAGKKSVVFARGAQPAA